MWAAIGVGVGEAVGSGLAVGEGTTLASGDTTPVGGLVGVGAVPEHAATNVATTAADNTRFARMIVHLKTETA